jgi:hypothetical protein
MRNKTKLPHKIKTSHNLTISDSRKMNEYFASVNKIDFVQDAKHVSRWLNRIEDDIIACDVDAVKGAFCNKMFCAVMEESIELQESCLELHRMATANEARKGDQKLVLKRKLMNRVLWNNLSIPFDKTKKEAKREKKARIEEEEE